MDEEDIIRHSLLQDYCSPHLKSGQDDRVNPLQAVLLL